MVITRLDNSARMSQAVVHNSTVYLSGQVAAPGASVDVQTTAVLASIDALLARSGSDKSRILSATIWLADMNDFASMNKVWDGWVDQAAPARATGEAKLATPDYKVEIIITAACD
jgi:enamine deaminase RidA (YjgF/YER057c/UK114 family)